jgi:hypothetical protein
MHQLRIDLSGTITMVYSDELAPLMEEGTASIKRASHVEPTPDGKWTADLSPVGGPILGPMNLRAEALAAEVEWLSVNVIGRGL